MSFVICVLIVFFGLIASNILALYYLHKAHKDILQLKLHINEKEAENTLNECLNKFRRATLLKMGVKNPNILNQKVNYLKSRS